MTKWIRLSLLPLLLLTSGIINARNAVVTDSSTLTPLGKASVFNRKGKMVGVCDKSGVMPDIPLSSYPVTIKVVGYKPAVISAPADSIILMTPADYNLPELNVDSRRHQVLHIIGYLREYSSLATYTDTVFLFREKTVDFMIPTKRIKSYKGWTHQRVLASKSYYHITNSEGLDSVSRFFPHLFSWSDLVDIVGYHTLPEKLKDTTISSDTIYGQVTPLSIWRRNGDTVYLDNDILAEKDNPIWAPDFFKLFNMEVDFTRFNTSFLFSGVESNTILPENLSRLSFTIESKGRGKKLQKLFGSDDPVYMDTYGELYITDREYITVKEAAKLEKDPPLGDETGINPPPEAPELPLPIRDLIFRVNNFDTNKPKLRQSTDRFIHTMKKFDKKKRKNRLQRMLGK